MPAPDTAVAFFGLPLQFRSACNGFLTLVMSHHFQWLIPRVVERRLPQELITKIIDEAWSQFSINPNMDLSEVPAMVMKTKLGETSIEAHEARFKSKMELSQPGVDLVFHDPYDAYPNRRRDSLDNQNRRPVAMLTMTDTKINVEHSQSRREIALLISRAHSGIVEETGDYTKTTRCKGIVQAAAEWDETRIQEAFDLLNLQPVENGVDPELMVFHRFEFPIRKRDIGPVYSQLVERGEGLPSRDWLYAD